MASLFKMCKSCKRYRKVVEEVREIELAALAAEGGLAPQFVKCKWKEWKNHSPGLYFTECWDYNLENAARLVAAGFWSEEWRNELCDAIKRLPDMMQSLHLLGIVHYNLICQHIVIRRNADGNGWDIGFVGFGRSQRTCREMPRYADWRQLVHSIHYMASVLKRPLCAEINAHCERCTINPINFS